MATVNGIYLVAVMTLFSSGSAEFPFRDVTLPWDQRVNDLVSNTFVLFSYSLYKIFKTI